MKSAERQRMTLNELLANSAKGWHGIKLDQPDWSDHSHSIAFTVNCQREDAFLFHLQRLLGAADIRTAGARKTGGIHGDGGSTLLCLHRRTSYLGKNHPLLTIRNMRSGLDRLLFCGRTPARMLQQAKCVSADDPALAGLR